MKLQCHAYVNKAVDYSECVSASSSASSGCSGSVVVVKSKKGFSLTKKHCEYCAQILRSCCSCFDTMNGINMTTEEIDLASTTCRASLLQ